MKRKHRKQRRVQNLSQRVRDINNVHREERDTQLRKNLRKLARRAERYLGRAMCRDWEAYSGDLLEV